MGFNPPFGGDWFNIDSLKVLEVRNLSFNPPFGGDWFNISREMGLMSLFARFNPPFGGDWFNCLIINTLEKGQNRGGCQRTV